MNDEQERQVHNKNRLHARGFSTVVYIGGVIAASLLFISFVLLAFPPDAYLTRVLMTVAGIMVGGSMLAFPYALHNWAVTKEHRKWTTILYYVEMVVIGVNTVVSFVSLLAQYKNYPAPEWVILYEPFSVASIIYTIFAWGTVFLLDPEHKLHAQEQDAEERYNGKIARKREEFIDSIEGEDMIEEIARADAMARFAPANYQKGKRHFGSGHVVAVDPSVGFVEKNSNSPLAKLDGEN